MPELPEVETVRRGLAPYLTGARIDAVALGRPDLRFPFPPGFAARLAGQTILSVDRRAKYLLFGLSDGATWLAHLGMTGSFAVGDAQLVPGSLRSVPEGGGKHRHLIARLAHPDHGALTLSYSDPRRFGFMDLLVPGVPSPHLDGLGPEPLGNGLNAPGLHAVLSAKRAPVKAALLDQRVIAGLGNIYVCEALFRSAIAPTRSAAAVTPAETETLVRAIRDVLAEAIAAGGSTLRDFSNAEGRPGYFQHTFLVYDREGEPCPRPGCTGTIARIVQAGRSSFYCPVCQD